jgi:hypothetical protein
MSWDVVLGFITGGGIAVALLIAFSLIALTGWMNGGSH